MRDGSFAVQLISDTCISLRHQGYLYDCTSPHRTQNQKDHGKSCEPSEDTDSPVDLVPERHEELLHVPPPSLEVTFKVPRADGRPSECGMEYRIASCLPVIVHIVPLTTICISKIFTWRA